MVYLLYKNVYKCLITPINNNLMQLCRDTHASIDTGCQLNSGKNCEAQARVRQGSARVGSQGERPQSLNPCLELTLKLVATHHHPDI